MLSPDGNSVYVSADDGHLYAVPMAGGSSRRVSNARGPGVHHYLHGVSPDGSTLAYIGLDSRGGVAYGSFPPGTLGHSEDVDDVRLRLLHADGSTRELGTLFGGQGPMNVPSGPATAPIAPTSPIPWAL